MTERRWHPPSRPRAVENGLRARSSRGAIGESWWSRRFLDVLESFAMGNRLTRGRAYARKGQVVSLDVAPGEARATVQGSRAKPYQVTIRLAVFPEIAWARAEIALSEQALPSAKLLAGEVPPELEDLFAEAGAPLFPRSVNELDQRCTCPDREVPCKHLAATFYLLAEAFDHDPFLILRWRGRDREALLSRLRELRADVVPTKESEEGAPATAGTSLALAGLTRPTYGPERFWLPPAPLPARPATLDIDQDLLLRQLPVPGASLGGSTLVAKLRTGYQRFGGSP
jgi:uncharacterized Zn finger protein